MQLLYTYEIVLYIYATLITHLVKSCSIATTALILGCVECGYDDTDGSSAGHSVFLTLPL